MGKYPFSVGSGKIYPMAGVDFDFAISAKANGQKWDTDLSKLNTYWFDIGLGADIPVALDGKLCIRPQFLVGFQMNRTEGQKQAKATANLLNLAYIDGIVKSTLGVGVIYKF